MTARPKLGLSARTVIRWTGRRLGALFASRPPAYVRLTLPNNHVQRVRNTRTGELIRYSIRTKDDYFVGTQIYEGAEYDLALLARHDDIVARYEAIAAAGRIPLIIDCGGNIGLVSKYFVERFPKARVLCVKPAPENFALVEANCTEPQIVPIRAAISSRDTRGRVTGDPNRSNARQVEADPEGDTPFMTIPALIGAHGEGCEPFIVKIDIEGFERDLFADNNEWLDSFYLAAVELHDWMTPGQALSGPFLRTVAPLDRDFVHIGETVFSISNRAPV